FLDKPVSDETLSMILEAGMRAPMTAQLCSVVYTRDWERIKSLRIAAYKTSPLLLIFLVDFHRLEKMMKKKEYKYGYDDLMSLWLGLHDVLLAVENLTIAAEALGLGSVLLGLTPLRSKEITAAFNLPERVFPVIGLNLGYPDPVEDTEIRPRFPIEFTTFEDEYVRITESGLKECMNGMDEGFLAQRYYIKERTKVPLEDTEDTIDFDRYSWSEHLSRKFRSVRWKGEPFLSILERHGFRFRD
ncbi:MAG: nitroreductase family protein, partial [Candidatus Thorarchaeota archaeon]